jgi:predicted enzyme related to lactoylglutathione lyase
MADDIITGTDFVSVPAADFDAGVAFYGDTLGLRRSTYLPERGFAEFETGTLTLGLFRPDAIGMDVGVTTCPIALHVEDMPAARERLTSAGVTFDGDTRDTGVCHMAMFHDPHGNPLMLHHRYAPRD